MLQDLSFIPLQNICYKNNCWAAGKLLDKNSMKERRKRMIYEPKFIIKLSSSKLEESFQVKEH